MKSQVKVARFCKYATMELEKYTATYMCVYVYILPAYTKCSPANVNMKHYRSHSNFDKIGPLISFW